MSYENAPATKLLATHCAACARPLVDAVSAECGLGPECRRKYLVTEPSVTPAAWDRANALIHQVALDQHGMTVLNAVAELRALGFGVVADRITERVQPPIEIREEGAALVVRMPYSEDAANEARAIPGRFFDRERKANVFRASSRPAVWNLLRRFFPGRMGVGPRGGFTVPSAA